MAVRWKPRGLDMHPGRRVCYKFWNEITEAKGIPPRYTYGTIRYVRAGHAMVDFEGTEPPYLPSAEIPIPYLAPDDDPDNALGFREGEGYTEWWNRHKHEYVIPSLRYTPARWEPWDYEVNARAALVERAENRFGHRSYWKRATRNWYKRNRIPLPADLEK